MLENSRDFDVRPENFITQARRYLQKFELLRLVRRLPEAPLPLVVQLLPQAVLLLGRQLPLLVV